MPGRKDNEEEAVEFKVVDRRPFNSEGELRPDLPPEPAAPEPRPQPTASKTPPPPAAPAAAQGKKPESTDAASAESRQRTPGQVQFEHLIMSLVSSAMYHLGMASRPGEIAKPPDLPAARETIDLLAILQNKTKGNLTPEEDQLLSGSLQELRLVFVEITRQAGRIP